MLFIAVILFHVNLIMFCSIRFIIVLTSSSDFPVRSSSCQLSSKFLPIKGQPTLQPIDIAISGFGISESSLESLPVDNQIHLTEELNPLVNLPLCPHG